MAEEPSEPKVDIQTILDQFRQPRPNLGPFGLLLSLVFLGAVIWGGFYLAERLGGGRSPRQKVVPITEPLLVSRPVTGTAQLPFVAAWPGRGEHTDLFSCTSVPTTTCDNLTNSPAIAEAWPESDSTGTWVVYYGISEANVDLYLLDMPPSMPTRPLTIQAGDSGLHTNYEITPTLGPAFSPSGNWIAFPAQEKHGHAMELFVAHANGKDVRRITDEQNRIRDYVWLDDLSLVIVLEKRDGSLRCGISTVDKREMEFEPLPDGCLPQN